MKKYLLFLLLPFACMGLVFAQPVKGKPAKPKTAPAKTTVQSRSNDTAVTLVQRPQKLSVGEGGNAKVDETNVSLYPAASLQQYLKGRAAGLYVQEPSGEPGTDQLMYIRGAAVPLFSARDVLLTQPLVLVDGLPLVSNEHPFAYDIQQYDFNRIGPANNLLAGVDLDNIASVEVIKDIDALARYGPRATNGVIDIKTKAPQSKKLISVHIFSGVAVPGSVTTINGNFENNFRKPFYDRYATADQRLAYPSFLKDSLGTNYFGPSNWTDSYYGNAAVYGASAAVTGGSSKASFKFSLGTRRIGGVADKTGLSEYHVGFIIKMNPLNWLTVTTSVNAHKIDRTRNRFLRDRLAEVRYLPDLSQPISPNNAIYSSFLAEYDKSLDNNRSNLMDGFLQFGMKLGKVEVTSKFGVSYTEGYRDLFFPSTIMEAFSYASNYFGYNVRMTVDNRATYNYEWKRVHKLSFEAGQAFQWDRYRYNYAYANVGSNDFIKVNLLRANLTSANFRQQYVYRFLDNTANNVVSFHGRASYSYKDIYTVAALVRSDGSSNAQPTSRWFISPVVSAMWNAKNHLLAANKTITQLKVRASYGRLGRIELDDRLGQGPQYTVDVGWNDEPRLGAYGGLTTLSRPYTSGFVGYAIPWTYTVQANAGIDLGLWKDRVSLMADVYSRTTKNGVLGIPSFAEYGYTKSFVPGMEVNNTGVELTLAAQVFSPESKFQWLPSLNINYNRNKLNALPNNLQQLVIGNRKLEVGKATDQYWVLANEGIYNSDGEVPINPQTGMRMDYKGTVLKAGDPKWKDLNGDYTIDDNDKVLKGHTLPQISGSFSNRFRYQNWDMGIDLYYNLGRHILNQQMANRFDFINREANNNINSAREITFWEKRGDYGKYPIYNPFSAVLPYQLDQDLFLENGSFLKLRTVSVGYDLFSLLKKRLRKSDISKLYLYIAANNLFTLTPYSGGDPELVDYTGYDNGYGMPIPRTYTFGIKANL